MAYIAMAITYSNLGEAGRAAENARKAYELREKVSERERFSIEANYYLNVTGELEKASQTFRVVAADLPERPFALMRAWDLFTGSLGNYEKALEQYPADAAPEPNDGTNYANVGGRL